MLSLVVYVPLGSVGDDFIYPAKTSNLCKSYFREAECSNSRDQVACQPGSWLIPATVTAQEMASPLLDTLDVGAADGFGGAGAGGAGSSWQPDKISGKTVTPRAKRSVIGAIGGSLSCKPIRCYACCCWADEMKGRLSHP